MRQPKKSPQSQITKILKSRLIPVLTGVLFMLDFTGPNRSSKNNKTCRSKHKADWILTFSQKELLSMGYDDCPKFLPFLDSPHKNLETSLAVLHNKINVDSSKSKNSTQDLLLAFYMLGRSLLGSSGKKASEIFIEYVRLRRQFHDPNEHKPLPESLHETDLNDSISIKHLFRKQTATFLYQLRLYLGVYRIPVFGGSERKWSGYILPKLVSGKTFEMPYFRFARTFHSLQKPSLSKEQFSKLESLCSSESERAIIRFTALKTSGVDYCRKELQFSKESIKYVENAVPAALYHLQIIKNLAEQDISAKVRIGNIKHPVQAIRYRTKNMLEQWRLLRRVTKVQGATKLSDRIQNFHSLLEKFIIDHGGVMKDRNHPIDGIVSGPRLSLDRITDYAQSLAAQESLTISKTTVHNELATAGVKLKKPKNDISQFNMDDILLLQL